MLPDTINDNEGTNTPNLLHGTGKKVKLLEHEQEYIFKETFFLFLFDPKEDSGSSFKDPVYLYLQRSLF